MAIVTTLNASDYSNFSQKYSDKNIINNIYGKEYIITRAGLHELSTISGEQPKIIYVNKDNISFRRTYSWGHGNLWKDIYNRVEEGYISGRFEIKTDEIITDFKWLTVDFKVEYDRYETSDNIINGDNYDSGKLIYTPIAIADNKKNETPLSSREKITRAESTFTRYFLGLEVGSGKDVYSAKQYDGKISKKIVKNPDGTITIIVDYKILVWSAANATGIELVLGIPYTWNVLAFLANKITLSVRANTIETKEIEFQYNIDDFIENSEASRTVAKTYEMETNEFLQTEETSDPTDRMSYKIAHQVFDAFDKNRPIITFDLLNCEKYKIGDKERYLESGDQIMVLDQFGQYIGEELNENGELIPGVFEIIKVENKWNGSYHKVVTAKQINT